MKTIPSTLVFAAALTLTSSLLAQSYPAKPVRLICPIAAGSATDTIAARPVGQKLSELWGRPVVVDNRPGAAGTIGAALVAKSTADGYTLLVDGPGFAANPSLYSNLSYSSSKDFAPVAPLVTMPYVLVVAPSAGLKTVSELIASAKAKPGQLNFASVGVGTGTHFVGEKFKMATGTNIIHVPYKGGSEAMADVMTARVTYWLPSLGFALPFIQGGKLIALGVASRERVPLLPEVPTISQAGVPGFEDAIWFGIWAPAATPADIVGKLASDIARALAAPDLRERLGKMAAEPLSMSPPDFARFVRHQVDASATVVKVAGIKLQ